MHLGGRLRELRKARNMTLVELSQASGIDPATISRIETGKMTGTLNSHMQLAKALSVSLPDLYAGLLGQDRETFTVQTTRSESDVYVHEAGKANITMLTTNVLKKHMMPVLINVEPGGSTQMEEAKLGTERFVYVLDGQIEAVLGKERIPLRRQQTLYFDASRPHQLVNTGKRTAKCLCVTTPPSL